jgi:hypothetical protein
LGGEWPLVANGEDNVSSSNTVPYKGMAFFGYYYYYWVICAAWYNEHHDVAHPANPKSNRRVESHFVFKIGDFSC